MIFAASCARFLWVRTAPFGLPVLPPAGLNAYQQRLGIAPVPAEVSHTAPLPQYFADRLGWQNLARTVAEVSEYLKLVSNAVERDLYLKRLADRLGVDEGAVRAEVLPREARGQRQARHCGEHG
mgnify:CR=1 FL=1